MLVIAWQYLTGRCVATDFTDRELAEWPPHPDRVFQALVASWGERGEDSEERKALQWLEQLAPPQLVAPDPVDQPKPVKVYVPVNDLESKQKKYSDSMLKLLPEQREKKERYFPSIVVGDTICALVWPDADLQEYWQVLERICAGVVRIGHSSSLVRCWVTQEIPGTITYKPVETPAHRKDLTLRVPEAGRLDVLITHHQAIVDKRMKDILPPRSRQIGYVRNIEENGVAQGDFQSPLLIFRIRGSRIHLRQTLSWTQAFRHALISVLENIPELQGDPNLRALISGHDSEGKAVQNIPHLAYLPLAFAGHDHADGHLLGMALAFPRGLKSEWEDGVYRIVGSLIDAESIRSGNAENESFRLYLGAQGVIFLQPEDSPNPLWNLRSETWCKPSRTWASMTPIVMDRMQNARRHDPAGWAAEQIMRMCEKQGLPRPMQVLVRPVSFLTGAPAVHEYNPLQRKDGTNRRMVHARIIWEQEVAGPVILGAGRFKGYGFCKPVQEDK